MSPIRIATTPPHSKASLARGIGCSSCLQTTLEQPGYQPPAHFAFVLGITRKVSRQEVLFIREPPDEHEQKTKNSEQPVPGTECERQAQDQQQRSGIHRMTHQGIGSG